MERVEITINTENAAFTDCPASEIARILRKLAQDIENSGAFGSVRDINGNKVGEAKVYA